MKLCQNLSGETLKTIVDYFGVKSYATVSITIFRLKKELEVNRALVDDYKSISIDLTPFVIFYTNQTPLLPAGDLRRYTPKGKKVHISEKIISE